MAETLAPVRLRGDQRSYAFPVWNGIFDHRKKIGPALWVYLWCLDRITREESGIGFVLGGAEIPAERIASELHDSERTIRRHLERLARYGYIVLKRAAHGFTIRVANSRKFGIWRADKNGHQDGTKMPVRSDKSAGQMANFVRCIKEDTAVDSAKTQNLPPNPPKGVLSPRQLDRLSREMDRIAAASVGSGITEDDLLQRACARLLIPLEAARAALKLSYGEASA